MPLTSKHEYKSVKQRDWIVQTGCLQKGNKYTVSHNTILQPNTHARKLTTKSNPSRAFAIKINSRTQLS